MPLERALEVGEISGAVGIQAGVDGLPGPRDLRMLLPLFVTRAPTMRRMATVAPNPIMSWALTVLL
ncbi:hypothetical protein [Streptomyces nojiriensis]|uniref:hypothetical protein n=1 Tax=Streptomyces nojiriensis TaxID=66374 RepID=UPI001679875B|nr:hypothetical protein [Streptomyces nojiriensis]